MRTRHQLMFEDAARMAALPAGSVQLVVTSPPYPMIEMWDDLFAEQDPRVARALGAGDGPGAFERMHRRLDRVWSECLRVLVPGGILCINIGDATRTIGGRFALYPNHARVLSFLQQAGMTVLPAILWRKQTNAPNKFMGSGMLPPGAYVTLEHEYVLILRKGDKREFIGQAAKRRRQSAFFWEERNQWFSDVWTDLKGTGQELHDPEARKRSAAFPFELPYRLISMFSVKGDTVLDPFAGTGTTQRAAMAAGRNSVGYESDRRLRPAVLGGAQVLAGFANRRIERRLAEHLAFVRERRRQGGALRHINAHYGFPVVTRQETELLINGLRSVERAGGDNFEVTYDEKPQAAFTGRREADGSEVPGAAPGSRRSKPA